MKKLLWMILLFFDLMMGLAANYPPYYYIPSSGATISNLGQAQISGQTFYVGTNGAVNLGSNTYTLTYASLPYGTTSWNVIFDASQLTVATATNVNLFGETPLATYPDTRVFYIQFNVVWSATGSPVKKVNYFSNIVELSNFGGRVTFDSTVVFNDSTYFTAPIHIDTSIFDYTGKTLTINPNGNVGKGCTPWCTTGNSGTNSLVNYLGTTDSVSLEFRLYGVRAGRIEMQNNGGNTSFGDQSLLSNTSGNQNAAFGLNSLYYNTTGADNAGFGHSSLKHNTTGNLNTAIGYNALATNTTGSNNTAVGTALFTNLSGSSNVAVGYIALDANTTGSSNTAIGTQALNAETTGASNTAIGYSAGGITIGSYNTLLGASVTTFSGSTHNAIGIGYGAQPSSSQLAIAGVRSISIPQMTSSLGYVLTDTSGTGDFIPQPYSFYTQSYTQPVTGDSAVLTTSSNILDAAGTIAKYTVILPATPQAGQIAEFSTTHNITNLYWSTRLSSDLDAVETHVPTTLSAGGTIKIQYNVTSRTWYNY